MKCCIWIHGHDFRYDSEFIIWIQIWIHFHEFDMKKNIVKSYIRIHVYEFINEFINEFMCMNSSMNSWRWIHNHEIIHEFNINKFIIIHVWIQGHEEQYCEIIAEFMKVNSYMISLVNLWIWIHYWKSGAKFHSEINTEFS